MRAYLAARFSRKTELREYRTQLEQAGIPVTSRWLDAGAHEWEGTPDHEIPTHVQGLFALEDLADLSDADVLVCFTEPPGAGSARGGRHTELGYAIARGLPVICVGPVENIFYALPQVIHVDDWAHALQLLMNTTAGAREEAIHA